MSETVIGYLRVSTREQGDSGLGLEAQRRAITEEADRRGWQVLWFEDAGYTGRNDRRPGLQAALRALKRKQAHALVVAKLDRLSRSVVHFANLLKFAQKQRWAIVSLDPSIDMTSPSGRLLTRILMDVAEWESEMIGVRTADAMRVAKAGGATFGRQRIVPLNVQRKIHRMRAEGMSIRAIAQALDAAGEATPAGARRWNYETVRQIASQEVA